MQHTSIIGEDCLGICANLGNALEVFSGGTIAVTGAHGFLCSYIVDVLAQWNQTTPHPCQILAVDSMITGTSTRLSHLKDRNDIVFLDHDLTSPLPEKFKADWIVHGASIASPTFYRKFPLETLDANVLGTRQILEYSRQGKVKGVLLLSSSEVYGDPDPSQIPTSEDYEGRVSSFGPRACYDESKRLAETLAYIYASYFRVPVTVVRPFNVFGPGQRLDDGRIIPDIMSAVAQRKNIQLFSDGTATRSFCYIGDFVNGLFSLLIHENTHGKIYNLGNDELEISINDLADRMCKVAEAIYGQRTSSVEMTVSKDTNYTTDNPQRRRPDLSKVKNTIDYRPQVSLDEGLRRTLLSYLEILG